jgi:hypothetical protein
MMNDVIEAASALETDRITNLEYGGAGVANNGVSGLVGFLASDSSAPAPVLPLG